jgi:hypothetical protein
MVQPATSVITSRLSREVVVARACRRGAQTGDVRPDVELQAKVVGGLEEHAGAEEPRAADGELLQHGPQPRCGRAIRGNVGRSSVGSALVSRGGRHE